MIRSDENPWMVVTTGVATRSLYVERQEVEPVVDDVELVGALEHRRDVQALGDLGVDRRVLGPATWRGGVQLAAVIESAVANSVTWWPAATSPSVSNEANCSHGP